MGWKTIITFWHWLVSLLSRLSRPGRPHHSDVAIFDPFVPLGAVKQLEDDYNTGYYNSEEDNFISDTEEPKRGFLFFRAIIIIVAALLASRLMLLQITQGQENFLLAEGNRLKTEPIPAPRGLFYDRNGEALVKNVPSFTLVFRSSEYPKKKVEREEYINRLSEVISVNRDELAETISKNITKETFVLREGIERDEALSLEVRLSDLRGVELTKTPVRFYSDVPGLGHLIGYTGKVTAEDLKSRPDLLPTTIVGKNGLEREYDELLQGRAGIETLEVDSLGRTIRAIGSQPAQAGQSLLLSVDAAVQRTAANSLQEAIVKNRATSGAAVVMDTRSGEIVAMVSMPAFDNNIFANTTDRAARQAVLSDPLSPLVNRAIAGQYPAGSTIKPAVAAAALQEKVVSGTTKIDTSEGKIVIGQWTFPDWKVHGMADVRQAIAESNNIFFYAVGGGHKNINGLGADRLADYIERFGFGKTTGIDLPGEVKGLVPRPDWKKRVKKEAWYIGDTYNLAIGQGDLLVTPLQLTRATGSIANGGTLLKPKMLKSVIGSAGIETRDVPAEVSQSNLVDSEVLKIVREGMRQTVVSGSARALSGLPVEVAAKTGTAQFNVAKDRTHSWFTAFAPFNSPEIAVSVIVEGGGEGFSVAAPVAQNIIEQYFGLPLTPINSALPNEN